DGLGSAESLWLKGDPTIEEIMAEIDNFDFSSFSEVVFCGYGEPTEALDTLIETAKYLKEKYSLKIRLNSNGLSDLINGKPTAHLLEGIVDSISISLNAPDAESYQRVARSKFGMEAFPALLEFAEDCKKYIPSVKFTVVDVLSKEEIERCKKIADDMGIPLRIREWIK
ncbi:MAG: TatD family nuclease-associated radical SAM protein, partial [Acutalibacteraceae bacterium]|nr:TatD family nuclease-associated radical SAM protein [Acutalibacteraceae bacterium]